MVLLSDIASITGGQFYNVEQASDLPDVFSRVADDTTGPTFSDDDQFSDSVEQAGIPVGISTIGGIGGQTGTIETHPQRADSDADGLDDDEELGEFVNISRTVSIGPVERQYEAQYYPLLSDPTEADTDRDGIQDYEERRTWNSDPRDENSDSDVYPDKRDPRVRTEDTPPEVTFKSTDWADSVGLVIEDDSEIESVEGNPFYNPIIGDSGYRPSKASVEDLDSLSQEDRELLEAYGIIPENADYIVSFDNFGLIDEPQRYYINVTDENENTASFQIDVSGRGAELSKASFAAGGALIIPEPEPTLVGDELVGAGIILGSIALYGASQINLLGTDGSVETLDAETKLSATEATYQNTVVGDVRLPVGFVATAGSALVGITERGYGWEYIDREVPGLTQEEIRQFLQNEQAVQTVTTVGGETLVIGDNPVGEDELIISIVNGVIATAYSGDTIEDPLGDEVIVDETDEHPIRDDDHARDYEEVKEVIRNPDQVYQNGRNRVYIKEIDGRWVTVRVFELEDGTYIVGTAPVYDTFSDVEEFLDNKGYPETPIYSVDD